MPLKSSSIEYGDQKLQAYKDSNAKTILLPENIKVLGFLNLSSINPGQSRQFSLKEQGIDDSVIFHSVLASVSGASNRVKPGLSFSILDNSDVGFTFDIKGTNSQLISFDFPSNMKVSPSDQVIIHSEYTLTKLTIAMQRIGILFDIEDSLTINVSSER